MQLEKKYDALKAKQLIEDIHFVLHCHHFNSQLHKAITATPFIDGKDFIYKVLRDDFYQTLNSIITKKNIINKKDILDFIQDFYRMSGFGLMDFSHLTDSGGKVISQYSHLSLGYKLKWGIQPEPVDDFGRSYISAAWAILFDKKPSNCLVKQIKCISCGDTQNEFIVEVV